MKSDNKRHRTFYAVPFVVLAISIVWFIAGLSSPRAAALYRHVYFAILLTYTWLIFCLLLWEDWRKKRVYRYDGSSILVIIPTYNEEPELFEQSLASVMACEGKKTVLVVNDGSTKNMLGPEMVAICRKYGAQLHHFESNQGKRHAIYYAVKKMALVHKYIVTIDSDTILDPKALVRVCAPLQNPRIGATTGNVLLLNERTNALTRMVGSYYWIGLEIFKRGQSGLGMVVCCSGCIAAYRSNVIEGVIDEFVGQEFLGEQCTHSEDRHLTNLVLRDGYDVQYIREAVSYTKTPDTVKGFLKQQQRWKRGYIREATFTLGWSFRTRPILFFQILLVELTIPFFSFGLMLSVLMMIFTHPLQFIVNVLPWWILFMFVRYIWVLFEARDKIFGMFVYMFMYEIALYWQFIWALCTVRNKSWITRV